MTRPIRLMAALAVLALAACESEPEFDPESFGGGVLRVAEAAGGAGDVLLYVNPDGTLAGAEGAEVEGYVLTRERLEFRAEGAGAPRDYRLAAAAFGPDYAGQVTRGGGCQANCQADATAWWASGNHKVKLPR